MKNVGITPDESNALAAGRTVTLDRVAYGGEIQSWRKKA